MEKLTGQTNEEMFVPCDKDSNYFYIDHNEYNIGELLTKLDVIIFGDSYILTWNDNSDGINIPEGEEYIYKGN